jgi:hypothetical protein
MGYKKQRLGLKLIRAARSRERYRDIHVFVGGTGAVGGTALLQMLSMYEEMISIHPPPDGDGPILVATGQGRDDIEAFTERLFRFIESRSGASKLPREVGPSKFLTYSGIVVELERFQLTALSGLEGVKNISFDERRTFVQDFLSTLGESSDPVALLKKAISQTRPISSFLKTYQEKHFKGEEPARFRSVIIGIPIPSLVAYHLGHLEEAAHNIEGLTDESLSALKTAFRRAFRDDLSEVQTSLSDSVLVAHTTAVGGMYDEHTDDYRTSRTIRLGFAHSARDTKLIVKQREAEEFTKEYSQIGIKMLIAAAAIGIDEVRVRVKIPLHFQIEQMLYAAPVELFPGAKKLLPPNSTKGGGGDGGQPMPANSQPVPANHFVTVYEPLTVSLDTPSSGPVRFSKGDDLRPTYSIRSGENGFFTVANADALYRVMRVASASELGQVLATVGLFGDDPISPWFPNNICYYTETDNSRQVFDLLYQPRLLHMQLSGLEPMALQELGSAKHQGELHTLSLLILLHRLRNLDIDAIDPYVDQEHFDPIQFFKEHSRPLLFEDLEHWPIESLAQEMQILASAETPQELVALNPAQLSSGLFPEKDKALLRVLDSVLKAVWMIPSLGTPLLFERDEKTFVRTGYYVAPLDILVTEEDSITTWFKTEYDKWKQKGYGEADDYPCSFDEYRDYHICTGGFIDLRPTAILCTASNTEMNLRGKIKRLSNEQRLREELFKLEPYSLFTTCGLVALMFRLRGVHKLLKEAMTELGTLHEFRWQMPRDMNGHTLVIPGAVEALRMVAEGFEKTTGTERLDGIWGYERRPIPERWDKITGLKPKAHPGHKG